MKIVHICLCGPFNDGWNYQDNILPKYHRKLGYDVSILATPFVNDKESTNYLFYKTGEYYDNDIKIIRLPLMFSNKSKISKRFRLYDGLYKSLVSEAPDILFIHGLQFLDIRNVVKYVKKYPKVKVYVDGHQDFMNSARNWLSKYVLHGFIWNYCAHLIEPYTIKFWGVLPARVDFLIKMYKLPQEKVDLLVMGAEDEKVREAGRQEIKQYIREKYQVKNDDFLIITGGKIDKNKSQVLHLMEAVQQINKKNIKMIIFGSVVTEYKEEFNSLLSDRIQHIGWINSTDIYKYFSAGDLIVFPGLHSVLWEQAVGQGKPCVFKYIKGFTHVDLGGNCEFFYNDSVKEMKDVLERIINDKKLYNRMKNVAETKGISYFSYQKIAKKSIKL